ncbi:MAG: manganese efflux pump MntP family protein [Lachnospiraceae bacterium]
MNAVTIVLLAIGLAMDAFAVAVCKGLAMQKITVKICLVIGAWFGIFQALMPFIGYLLGTRFERLIVTAAPWAAFGLLGFIGAMMIWEALSEKEECDCECGSLQKESDILSIKEMFMLAVATSIDAMAVGVTFACVPVSIVREGTRLTNTLLACGTIGVITCLISILGVKIGNVFGTKYQKRAVLSGGILLVLLGIKTLFESFPGFF